MSISDRYEEYLRRAAEAEQQAQAVLDEAARATWLKVANGYRDLAEMAVVQRRRMETRN